MKNRRFYQDNIGWITVLIVVVYHVIHMFNGVWPSVVIEPFHEQQYQNPETAGSEQPAGVVYFLVGMSAFFGAILRNEIISRIPVNVIERGEK